MGPVGEGQRVGVTGTRDSMIFIPELPIERLEAMFISEAFAQSTGGGIESQMMGLLPIVLMFVLLYFLMIRPQMKRTKEHRTMTESLTKGDEVVCAGGMLGRITKMTDAYITIEIAANTEIVVQRAAVSTMLPKGTLKSI